MGVQGQRIVPAAFGEGVDGARLRAAGPPPRGGLRLHARRHVPGALPRQPRRRVRRASLLLVLILARFGSTTDLSPFLRLQLVVIAGIVWNPPSSCAWAARVLVNSIEACRHGRKEVGLPSHVATFSKTEAASLGDKPLVKPNSFLNMLGIGSTTSKQGNGREIEISETKGSSTRHLCNISLPLTGSHKNHKWMGPAIKMSLPSFSGRTEDHPDLLKYSCQVECRVRPVKPARIWSPRTTEPQEKSDGKINSSGSNVIDDLDAQSQSISVLLSRPIFALEFSSLRMHVDAPKIVVPHCKKKKVGYSST
ncbi:protein NEOXANTHIN-DEFICIENT 1-like isoform X3 [Miscanthus floridulus]|uniref:protein NEOXANTHIN-DEFICIENT 1-like isoform X3 n=1 Tax=Miscanthus floridulus TaxID=154761 RepID=UPI003459533D